MANRWRRGEAVWLVSIMSGTVTVWRYERVRRIGGRPYHTLRGDDGRLGTVVYAEMYRGEADAENRARAIRRQIAEDIGPIDVGENGNA